MTCSSRRDNLGESARPAADTGGHHARKPGTRAPRTESAWPAEGRISGRRGRRNRGLELGPGPRRARPEAPPNGFLLGHDGLPLAVNPYPNGDLQHAFRMPTTCQLNGFPGQDWLDSHVQFASGRNDGFVISGSGPVSMGYWEQADQPFYYSLASVFPIADRYFCSVLGQTYPNRRYLIGATSIGQVDDTLPNLTDYPPNGTLFDRLDAAGVAWKDYYSSTLTLDGITLPGWTTLLYPPAYLKNPAKTVLIDQFFSDAKAGSLPGYCIVEPDYDVQSEENPQNIVQGEAFAASVINAVMTGPAWSRT